MATLMRFLTARRFAAISEVSRIACWTDFWESAGLRMKTAALPAAALLSRVFCITQTRSEGRSRDGPPLSQRGEGSHVRQPCARESRGAAPRVTRRTPAPPFVCMQALFQPSTMVPAIRKRR